MRVACADTLRPRLPNIMQRTQPYMRASISQLLETVQVVKHPHRVSACAAFSAHSPVHTAREAPSADGRGPVLIPGGAPRPSILRLIAMPVPIATLAGLCSNLALTLTTEKAFQQRLHSGHLKWLEQERIGVYICN